MHLTKLIALGQQARVTVRGWNVRRSIDARGYFRESVGRLRHCRANQSFNREGTVTQLTATRRTFL